MQADRASIGFRRSDAGPWTSTDWAYASLLMVLGLAFVLLPQSAFLTAIPGDLGDARFNSVILEHVYRWVTGQVPSLWNPQFFYPFPDVLAFSDNHFGSAPVYILLRLIGLDRYQAFSGWFTIGGLLNYLCCCLFLRAMGFSGLAAGAGAFVFSFGLPVTGQETHAQLTYRFAGPLAMLALQNLLDRRDLKYLAWLAVWVVVQFYCTIYIGVFLILLIVPWTAAQYVVRRPAGSDGVLPHQGLVEAVARASSKERVVVSAVCLGAAAILAALLARYQIVAAHYGFVRKYAEIATMLPRPISYLLADHSLIWRWISELSGRLPMFWEHRLFCGVGASVLLVVGVVKGWSKWVAIALISLVFLIIATLSLDDLSIYPLFFALPGFNAIRAVSRIWFVEIIPASIIMAAGVDALTRGIVEVVRVGSMIASLLIGLTFVESSLIAEKSVTNAALDARIALLRAKLPADLKPDAILLYAESPIQAGYKSQLDAMVLAQELGIATINGYSGNFPPGYFKAPRADCRSGQAMLSSYVNFAHADEAAFKALAARVVPLGFAVCDPAAWRLDGK